MEYEYDGRRLKFDKELSELDKIVIDFVKMLSSLDIKYVIVSGYVAILLGRSRTTEDIDLFIEKITSEKFQKLFNVFEKEGFWTVDAESLDDAFDRLQKNLSIRVAKKDTVIPNFEIKFAKKEADFASLNEPLEVLVNKHRLLMSKIEIQVPFKLWLGTDKDIEDALYIYELFKEKLDRRLLAKVAKDLKVEKEMVKYGIL